MIAEASPQQWSKKYGQACLDGREQEKLETEFPLAGHFSCKTANGPGSVEHLLLGLCKR
jgi:hypothetical protein